MEDSAIFIRTCSGGNHIVKGLEKEGLVLYIVLVRVTTVLLKELDQRNLGRKSLY